MAQTSWDNDIGPLILNYWSSVKRLYEMSTLKGLNNTTINTMCVSILNNLLVGNTSANNYGQGGNWANSTGLANSLLLACAAGIAANAFVGGA